MSRTDLSSVVVQEMFFSRHAKRKYRLAPQRMGIGTINLEGIDTQDEFLRYWHTVVCRKGKFSLLARDHHGRWKKCIGVIRISSNGLAFKDNRCALCSIFRNNEKKRPADMRI